MSPSKKDRFKNLIQEKDEPRESQSKKELIRTSTNASVNANVIDSMDTSTNTSVDTLSKVEAYKEKAKKREKQLTHDEMYQQQNVYIDRNIVSAIKKILKSNPKLTKQTVYNEALKMYLDIVHDIQVRLKSEE